MRNRYALREQSPQYAYPDVLELVVDAGLDPNVSMHDGRSVVFHQRLTPEAACLLLARGVDRTAHDTRGNPDVAGSLTTFAVSNCRRIAPTINGTLHVRPSYQPVKEVCMKDELVPAKTLAAKRVGCFSTESRAYAEAREALLAEEIEVRRHLGRLARQNRALPEGPAMDAEWSFVGMNGGRVGLADMFGEHDTLVLYHWMYGLERQRPCPMCTNLLGPLAANAADLLQQVALAVVARSPVERMIAFGVERGWRDLPYYQAVGDDFSVAIGGLDPEKQSENPVLMVLTKRDGKVRLHWMGETSMEMADPGEDPRGAVDISPLWNVLDLTPAGRAPTWYPRLTYTP